MQSSEPQIEIVRTALATDLWQGICADTPVPLQQHPLYGHALQSYGATVNQVFFLKDGQKIGTALLPHRKFFGAFRLATLFRGPLWTEPTIEPSTEAACLKALRNEYSPWRWNFLAALPEGCPASDTRTIYRKAGFRCVMTGFSTCWVDLRPDIDSLRGSLKGKWRNQLKGAEKKELQISIGGRKPHQYSWILEKETDQRSARGYQATPVGLVKAYVAAAPRKTTPPIMSVTALHKRDKVAGGLFLLHGNSATYHIGWAGQRGRDLNAQNLVLWTGMLALKEKGIRFLDLGGLNTAGLAGIARFKLGVGTAPTTFAGTYV
ncbi:MAG: hypothetical protein COB37_04960 [Kordiimonadales bacterium]|nr:MAG: hypothetical protein COB37_04960 [Kordiimonadales bacterium]